MCVSTSSCAFAGYSRSAAANIPDNTTAKYLNLMTLTPAASAAAGFSLTARSRKPNGVLYKTYQQIGISAKAKIEETERLPANNINNKVESETTNTANTTAITLSKF